ncbi:MAG TPA: YkvA family protein, partial [Acidimicrobiales bacterium]
PNFIPVIGQTDDFVVVVIAVRYACRRLPREDVVAAWPGDPASLDRLLGPPGRRQRRLPSRPPGAGTPAVSPRRGDR